MFDFANILFSGPCNAHCYFCIGRQVDPRLNMDNLDVFPLRNLGHFIELIRLHDIRQVVLTGTNTDPQLYRHEARLLDLLRSELAQRPPVSVASAGVQISLHTNGRRALRRMETFNRYDRVCLSLPAFDPLTYQRVMSVPGPPDLEQILAKARVPVKVSCVLTPYNLPELCSFLRRLQQAGVRRVVLRKLYGESRSWGALLDPTRLGLETSGAYQGNPVYDWKGMQVTLWDFQRAASQSLNLFSTGVISQEYLLTRAPVYSSVDVQASFVT